MDHDEERKDKIVSMETRAGLGLRVAAELRAYWDGVRGNRLVPPRSEINPRGIERALEFSFVLERVAPGMGRFRLAGMHLNDLMGMEVRGMPLTAFFTTTARKAVADASEAAFREPAIVEAELVSEAGAGRPVLSARLLLLPLRSDLGDVTRALGCLVAEGPVCRVPRRFEIKAIRIHPLTHDTVHLADSDHGFAMAPRPQYAGFAEEKATFEGAHSPEERRALFRVISGK
ncbi:PAS domain-containing protein [Paenirhodobacter sp.]|uniref:PAS domain-containing protein n=1 Tax=Paenirhodobacter sp. TaxID=1965326 RepID=UPI003B41D4DD